jgi:hypothetical protein
MCGPYATWPAVLLPARARPSAGLRSVECCDTPCGDQRLTGVRLASPWDGRGFHVYTPSNILFSIMVYIKDDIVPFPHAVRLSEISYLVIDFPSHTFHSFGLFVMRLFSLLVAAGTATLALAGPVAPRYGSRPFPDSIAKRNGSRTFRYFGVNEAGAEFASQALPGVLGKDYIWPSRSSIDVSRNTSNSLPASY